MLMNNIETILEEVGEFPSQRKMEKSVINGGYNPKKLTAIKKLYIKRGEQGLYYTHLKEIFHIYGKQ